MDLTKKKTSLDRDPDPRREITDRSARSSRLCPVVIHIYLFPAGQRVMTQRTAIPTAITTYLPPGDDSTSTTSEKLKIPRPSDLSLVTWPTV